MFEARKKTRGGDRRSEDFSKVQNGPLESGDTAQAIADELGVERQTVKRSEKFSKGIDALKEESPEAAEKVLQGGSRATKIPRIEKKGIVKQIHLTQKNKSREKLTWLNGIVLNISAGREIEMTKFDNFLTEQLKDPELKAEYDALEPEFAIIRAMIEARRSTGITQQELSKRTGIAQADISKLENGNANPSIKTLQRLAAGMGMRVKIEFQPLHAE